MIKITCWCWPMDQIQTNSNGYLSIISPFLMNEMPLRQNYVRILKDYKRGERREFLSRSLSTSGKWSASIKLRSHLSRHPQTPNESMKVHWYERKSCSMSHFYYADLHLDSCLTSSAARSGLTELFFILFSLPKHVLITFILINGSFFLS